MIVKFSDAPDVVCFVERIDDEMIDHLFYQEDEIGEFRHYAFMIECGLEDEDWSGPEVEPVPWPGCSDASSSSDGSLEKKPDDIEPPKDDPPPSPAERRLQRMHSSDDVTESEKERDSGPLRGPPRRKLVAAKSGTLHGMRATAKPEPSEDKQPAGIRSPPTSRKLVAAKSGTLHGMRQAAATAVKADDPASPGTSKPIPVRGRLTKTHSGSAHTLRRMRQPSSDNNDADASTTVRQRPQRSGPPVRSDSFSSKNITDTVAAVNNAGDGDDNKPVRAPRVRPARTIAPIRVKSGTAHTMRRPRSLDAADPNNGGQSGTAASDSVAKRHSDTDPRMARRQHSADSNSESESDDDNNSHSSSSVSISSCSTDGGQNVRKAKSNKASDDKPKAVTTRLSTNGGSSRITIKKDTPEDGVSKSSNGGKSRITITRDTPSTKTFNGGSSRVTVTKDKPEDTSTSPGRVFTIEKEPSERVVQTATNGGKSRITITKNNPTGKSSSTAAVKAVDPKPNNSLNADGSKVTTKRVANGGRSRIIIVKDKKDGDEKKGAEPEKSKESEDPNLMSPFRRKARERLARLKKGDTNLPPVFQSMA